MRWHADFVSSITLARAIKLAKADFYRLPAAARYDKHNRLR